MLSQFSHLLADEKTKCFFAYGRNKEGKKIIIVPSKCENFLSRITANAPNKKFKRFLLKRFQEYQKHTETSDEDYVWLDDSPKGMQKLNVVVLDVTPSKTTINLKNPDQGPSLSIIFDSPKADKAKRELDYNDLLPELRNSEFSETEKSKEEIGDINKNISHEPDPWITPEYADKLGTLGYHIADFYASGQYDRLKRGVAGLGDVFSDSQNVFDEEIGKQANEILKSISKKLLKTAKNQTLNLHNSQTKISNANTKRAIQKAETTKIINDGNNKILGAKNNQRKTATNLKEAKIKQQSLSKKAIKASASAEKALAFARSGSMDVTALKRFKEKIRKVVSKGSVGEGVRILRVVRELASEGNDIAIKAQYQDVYESLINENDLVTTWASQSIYDKSPVFQMSITSPIGKAIREVYNEALELENKANSTFSKEKAGFAMKWLKAADQSFYKNLKPQGNRYLNRARVLLDYETNHPRIKYYAQYHMNSDARKLFGVEANTKTYMGYQMVDISSKFAVHKDLYKPSALNFITTQTFKQAHIRSKQQNIKSFDFFHDQLDNLYTIYDGFLSGANKARHFLTSQTAKDLAGGFIFGSEESLFIMDANGQVKKMGKEDNAAFQTGRAIGLLIGGTVQVQFANTVGHGTGLLLDSTGVAVPAGIAVHAMSIGVTAKGTLAISKGIALLGSKGGNLMFSRRSNSERRPWKITNPDKTVYHPKFKNIYKDKKTGYWWSKDTAGHGDSKWKVFREVKTGFKWLTDADNFGTYIPNKHKSEIGKFIPWKEVKVVN